MHISWLGGTSIKLQTKHGGNDISTVIDTYKPTSKGGSFPTTLGPQVALFSNGQEGSITLQGTPFIIDHAGEYEVNGIMVQAIPTEHGLIFKLTAEHITVLHTGALKGVPKDALIGELGSIDVLFVPVGGKDTLSAKQAATLTTKLIEPRVCIPINFKHKKNDSHQENADAFLKEIGFSNGSPESKVILTASKLPQEEMDVVVLASG